MNSFFLYWYVKRLFNIFSFVIQFKKNKLIFLNKNFRSDPEDTLGWGVSPRGAGYLFGSDVVSQFNQKNNIRPSGNWSIDVFFEKIDVSER